MVPSGKVAGSHIKWPWAAASLYAERGRKPSISRSESPLDEPRKGGDLRGTRVSSYFHVEKGLYPFYRRFSQPGRLHAIRSCLATAPFWRRGSERETAMRNLRNNLPLPGC